MFRFRPNFALYIAGPSGCGKSQFCVKLLNSKQKYFTEKFHKVYWVLGDINAKPKNVDEDLPIEFLEKIPNDFRNESGLPCLYILDDSMFEAQCKNVANLFTVGCHHQLLSVIYITQNLFQQSKYSRDISLNANYFCIFRNPRDQTQIYPFARQIYPESPKSLVEVYKNATTEPFGYLLVDLHQTTPSCFRFYTDLFSDYLVCFCPTNLPDQINGHPVTTTVLPNIIQNEIGSKEPALFACIETCEK